MCSPGVRFGSMVSPALPGNSCKKGIWAAGSPLHEQVSFGDCTASSASHNKHPMMKTQVTQCLSEFQEYKALAVKYNLVRCKEISWTSATNTSIICPNPLLITFLPSSLTADVLHPWILPSSLLPYPRQSERLWGWVNRYGNTKCLLALKLGFQTSWKKRLSPSTSHECNSELNLSTHKSSEIRDWISKTFRALKARGGVKQVRVAIVALSPSPGTLPSHVRAHSCSSCSTCKAALCIWPGKSPQRWPKWL